MNKSIQPGNTAQREPAGAMSRKMECTLIELMEYLGNWYCLVMSTAIGCGVALALIGYIEQQRRWLHDEVDEHNKTRAIVVDRNEQIYKMRQQIAKIEARAKRTGATN